MMKGLILMMCVAYASAACCSIEDRREVLALWESIWSAQFSGRRIAIAQAVFDDLFEQVPAAKGLFSRVNVDNPDSPEFRSHCVRVINGLDSVINMAFSSGTLEVQLQHLGEQHAARDGVKAEYFEAIGNSFDAVLSQAIPCFNQQAWRRCFDGFTGRIAAALD